MIKLIIFIIIVLAIYYFATKIKVYHINSLPGDKQIELHNRSKIRSMLSQNHIKCEDEPKSTINSMKSVKCTKPTLSTNSTNSTNSTDSGLELFSNIISEGSNVSNSSSMSDVSNTSAKSSDPKSFSQISFDKLIDKIKRFNVEKEYRFNMPSLPVTFQYPDSSNKKLFDKYLKYIPVDIKSWSNSLTGTKIKLLDLRPILVRKTEDEFVLSTNAKLGIGQKIFYAELTYYGKSNGSDDFYRPTKTTIQLVNIKRITKENFNQNIRVNNGPFMSMENQMDYVKKINQMHDRENEY